MATFSTGLRSAVWSAALVVVTSAAIFLVLIVVALWAPRNRANIERHLTEAAQSGELARTVRFGPFSEAIGHVHTYSCPQANMMLAPPLEDRLADAMSNRAADQLPDAKDPHAPNTPDCQALLRAPPAFGGETHWNTYDRYINGMRIVGRIMLSWMPLGTMSTALLVTSYALIALIAALAVFCYQRGRLDGSALAGYLTIAFCLAFCHSAHYFDGSLMFGPMDCVQYVFVSLSVLWPLHRMRPSGLTIYGASYGALITIFEFLTGGIPLALALLPILMALGFAGPLSIYLSKLLRVWLSFCSAVILLLAAKKALAIAFFSENDGFLISLWPRLWGPISDEAKTQFPSYGFVALFHIYKKWTLFVAWGSANIGKVLICASVAALLIVTWRHRRGLLRLDLTFVWASWLSLLVLPTWAAVFMGHALMHPFVMARLLVIPIIAGGAAAAIDIARRL
jgi:hypothetical protein